MSLGEFRAFFKNTLRGFALFDIPPGLIVRDALLHEKNGKWWVSLPTRPMLDRERRHIAIHAGHKQYSGILGWRDRDLANRFSDAAVALIREQHPNLFDGGGP